MLRFRPLNAADQAWRELPTLAGRVVQIASRADSAAMLMDDGQWLLLWSDGSSTGPALPDHFRMIALASDRDTLYAIGAPPPPSPTTEQSNLSSLAPATTQAAQSDIARSINQSSSPSPARNGKRSRIVRRIFRSFLATFR